MTQRIQGRRVCLLALIVAALVGLSGCSSAERMGSAGLDGTQAEVLDTSCFLRIAGEEPDTADPQCTENYYDVALNVFDCLVGVQAEPDGTNSFVPSLADSWKISEDGLVYTFRLHPDVTFSNGSALTSSDVRYTFERALTNPDSNMVDVVEFVAGADEYAAGETDELEGFEVIDDQEFSITLTAPYAAFLATLSIPSASILDEETTEAAGGAFGIEPGVTVGTGPFVFKEWDPGNSLTLVANPNCWSGAPNCEGVIVQFVLDAEAKRLMFENGELDILDLEDLGSDAEYFLRGDIYQENLVHGRRIGLSYIALNEAVKPLDDVRVRKALQMSLDREAMLMSVYGGRGTLENGIYPHGLVGFNAKLPQIPYDVQAARKLLDEAGYPDGFDLEINVESDSHSLRATAELAAAMWAKVGVRTTVRPLAKDEFLEERNSGEMACYPSKFSVDYNDPDAIIYVFFGSVGNTHARSLNYPDEGVIDRVDAACSIVDDVDRLREYHSLEHTIVQQDCAWVPLFSNEHYFVVSDRVEGFRVSWNGWTNTQYRDIVIDEQQA